MADIDLYLSAAEAPSATTLLVNLHPLVHLVEAAPEALSDEKVAAEFPNQGRVTWSRPLVEPQAGSLWWHRIQPNPGFIPGLRGSNRWLVQDGRGEATPSEAVEILDLRTRFADDDRRLRQDLLTYGIALDWQPTRRVYLCLEDPTVWVGPVELIPRAQNRRAYWRIDPTTIPTTTKSLSLPGYRAAPPSAQVAVRLDGKDRRFLAPQAYPGERLPEWEWPTDDSAIDWLTQQLPTTPETAITGGKRALHEFIEHLADRADISQYQTSDGAWLNWANRAIDRLDLHDRVISAALAHLLDTPAVKALLPPQPDPAAVEAARHDGYQHGKADAEWVANQTITRLEQALAEAERTVKTLRQTISDEREELDRANIQAQREAEARRTAEREHDKTHAQVSSAHTQIAALNEQLTTACTERDAARSAYHAAETAAATLRTELEAAQTTLETETVSLVTVRAALDAARADLVAEQCAATAFREARDMALQRALAAEDAVETLSEELEAAQGEIRSLSHRSEASSAGAGDQDLLTEMLALAQQQTAEARSELAHVSVTANGLRVERDQLHKQLQDVQAGRSHLQEEIKKLKAEVAGLKAQLEGTPALDVGGQQAIASEQLDHIQDDVTHLRETVQALVDELRMPIDAVGPVALKPEDSAVEWSSPWASLPSPQPLIAESVAPHLSRVFRDHDLPKLLARPIWGSLQAGKLPVLAGHGARRLLAVLADLCFGGRRLPVEVDPGLLAPSDLLGTLHDGRLRPAASHLVDLLLQHQSMADIDDPQREGPALVALYGVTRAPVDAYLLPLLAHYAQPVWAGGRGDPLGPLLPAALDVADPYERLGSYPWPRSVLIASTVEGGITTVPPPPALWEHATFHCLDHAQTESDLAAPMHTNGAVASHLADLGHEAELTGQLGAHMSVAMQQARTTVSMQALFPNNLHTGDAHAADKVAKLGAWIEQSGGAVPTPVLRAATACATRGYSDPAVLASVLLPWAITAGADRTELAEQLMSHRDADDDESMWKKYQNLADCLECMERLLR